MHFRGMLKEPCHGDSSLGGESSITSMNPQFFHARAIGSMGKVFIRLSVSVEKTVTASASPPFELIQLLPVHDNQSEVPQHCPLVIDGGTIKARGIITSRHQSVQVVIHPLRLDVPGDGGHIHDPASKGVRVHPRLSRCVLVTRHWCGGYPLEPAINRGPSRDNLIVYHECSLWSTHARMAPPASPFPRRSVRRRLRWRGPMTHYCLIRV